MNMFISEDTWNKYAEIIAMEDIEESVESIDEDLLKSKTIKTNEIGSI